MSYRFDALTSLFKKAPIALSIVMGALLLMAVSVVYLAPAKAGTPRVESVMALKEFINNKQPRFQKITTDDGIIYALQIPVGSRYTVLPEQTERLTSLKTFAATQQNTVAVINAGFFDPSNHKTVSYVQTVDGTVLDPETNERLTNNKGLAPYMQKLLNRSEFRVLSCKETSLKNKEVTVTRYAIQRHLDKPEISCEIKALVGGGPRLLSRSEVLIPEESSFVGMFKQWLTEEAFWAQDETDKVVRDPVGAYRPNARSAVGITAKGDVLLVVLGQDHLKSGDDTRKAATGFGLDDLAATLHQLGAVDAMALDGGSSSGMWVQGNLFYGKWKSPAVPVERALKSFLVVTQNNTAK